MSATVAAALKKIAVAILTDKKLRKAVLGIVLGIIIIVIMPVLAVIALFNGDINIDTDRLQQIVVEEMSDEEKAKLQAVEDTMKAIETAMTEKGFTAERTKEAQVLYTLALSDHSKADGFVERLVGCFAEDQTDEQLIAAVNSAFGTELKSEDYSKIMNSIRAKAINVSKFVDPETKNNVDLAEWAKQAYAKKWGYVYGTFGEVLNESILTTKISQFPEQVGENEGFIRQHWLGGRTADCIGLIKGYAWFNCDTGQIEYRSNGVRDTGSDPMLDMATEKGTIDTMPDIPSIAVWMDGHIGIYVGDGQTIHAANTELGVIMTPLAQSGWTHWLKVMHKRKTYAVFGLGRYGTAVAKELVDNGMEVIAVDSQQRIVDDAAAFLPVCKCGDVTDADVITKLGIRNIDTVIVCMASNLEASVMAVTLCKEVGVPTVIAKCANEMHQKILLRVGADKVIFPEYESGIRLAKNLISSGFVDMVSLSQNVSMVEIEVKPEWVGKSLIELDFRRKYAFNIVAIRQGEEVTVNINPEQPLSGDMILIVIAKTTNLRKL